MSRICGIYQKKEKNEECPIDIMSKTMRHTDSDCNGIYSNNRISLSHNILKYNKTSTTINQPFISNSGKYVLLFDGYISNFQELEQQYNFTLKTGTNIEFLMNLFELKGENFVNELNGMFSIAIYAVENNTLYIFRDRLGMKPLYYYENSDFFIFGSELKSIVGVPFISKNLKLNQNAVSQYLHLGYIPAPNTIYQDIFKFPQGAMMKISTTQTVKKQWWKFDETTITNNCISDETKALEVLENLLSKSVRNSLINDLPVGTLLSGGIDSSLVTAIAAKQSNKQIDTFCAKFEHNRLDESKWAAKIAQYIGTNHHQFTVTEKDASDFFPIMIQQYDEPYGDTSAIPTMLISRFVSKYTNTVLMGDGGDELFLGYGAYLRAEMLAKPLISFLGYTFRALLKAGNSKMRRASYLFEKSPVVETKIFSQATQSFSHNELSKILNYPTIDVWKPTFYPNGRIITPAEHQAIFDLSYYLPDELIIKVDRATALFGIEARSPFLDNTILDFSLNLNPNLKIKDGKGKYLLIKLLEKYVPKELTDRQKQGFAIPLQDWMLNGMKDIFIHYLSPEILKKYNIINIKETQKLLNLFYVKKQSELYVRLWLLASLNMWLEQSKL